jgi:hypothetical protein
MKKLFFVAVCFCASSNVYSQKGAFHMGLNIGYGLPHNGYINSTYTSNSNIFTDEVVLGSYGSGFNAGLWLGYDMCKNVGADLEFDWFSGKKYEYVDNHTGFNTTFNGSYAEKANGFFVAPQLRVFTFNPDRKIDYNARFGPVFAVGVKNKLTIDETSGDAGVYSQTTKSIAEFNSSTGFGFTGSFGLEYRISNRISLTADAFYRGINLFWKTATLTEYSSTYTPDVGDPITETLTDLDVSDKEFEYVDKITEADNVDPDKPTKILKEDQPFGSYGIRIGISLNFGEKE